VWELKWRKKASSVSILYLQTSITYIDYALAAFDLDNRRRPWANVMSYWIILCGLSNSAFFFALQAWVCNCYACQNLAGRELQFFDQSKVFDTNLSNINSLTYMSTLPAVHAGYIIICPTDPIQSVVLNGVQPCLLGAVPGVPQGSVMRLLLFLVYINSAVSSVHHSNIKMMLLPTHDHQPPTSY